VVRSPFFTIKPDHIEGFINKNKRGPSSADIITLLKDFKYLMDLKERLATIKEMQGASPPFLY
jgi:hypothetical protein